MKGKYIYYSAGSIGGGLLLSMILKTFFGLWGMLIGVAIGGALLWWVIKLQDTKGLYNKTRNDKEIYIFPKRRIKIYK